MELGNLLADCSYPHIQCSLHLPRPINVDKGKQNCTKTPGPQLKFPRTISIQYNAIGYNSSQVKRRNSQDTEPMPVP